MSETMHGAIVQPGNPVEYQPRHAAPEVDPEHIEQQARAANDYRYAQVQKQFDAEFALSRGQFGSSAAPKQRRRYAEKQQHRIDQAKERQQIADRYVRKKYAEAQDARGRRPFGAPPRHLREEEPPSSPTHITEPLGAIATPGSVHVPTPRDRLQNVITGLDILPEVPEDVITGLDILFEEEAEQAAPPVEPAPQKAGLLGRTGYIWRRANVAVASYFSDPEKGRRRQIAATLGLYALLGSTAWLLGHHPLGEHEQYGAGQPSTTIPPSPVPVAPTQPPHDALFFDNLYPSNYHGEAYEWSTAADQFGPAYATQELQEMIGYARQSGVSVDTWGSAAQGHWGIASITVPLDGGGYQTYYDTPHKLAILQHFSAGQ